MSSFILSNIIKSVCKTLKKVNLNSYASFKSFKTWQTSFIQTRKFYIRRNNNNVDSIKT